MPHYVYVILCEGGSFYTGYTKNLKARMKLHMKGKGARYTKTHRPRKLVYVEKYDSRAEAMRRERRVKKLTHRQKIQLTTIRGRQQTKLKKSIFRSKMGKSLKI